jgi:hypothetical protein
MIIGALVALSASAQAQTATDGSGTAASPAAMSAPSPDRPDDVICRMVRVDGSYFPSRICHTRAKWDNLRRQSQDMMRGIQNNAFSNNSTNGG